MTELENIPDVYVITYQLLLHNVKALLTMPPYLPKVNETIINKRKIWKRALGYSSQQGTKFHGYQIEHQFHRKLPFHKILQFAKN